MAFCTSCGAQLHGDFCSKCGSRTGIAVPTTAQNKKGGCLTGCLVGGFLLSAVAIILIFVGNDSKQERSTPSPVPSPVRRTQNEAHDRLVALPPDQRAAFLAAGVGEGCLGDLSFLRGLDPKSGRSFWTVHCTNGKSYQLMIEADATGSSKVADCTVLAQYAHEDCYKRIPGTIE